MEYCDAIILMLNINRALLFALCFVDRPFVYSSNDFIHLADLKTEQSTYF